MSRSKIGLNFESSRKDFPILKRQVNGKPLIYLDSAASSQKPNQVLQAMDDFYTRSYANIHRGIHTLSAEATKAYEDTRDKVARFVNAPERESIVFTSGATEGVNLVASSFGDAFLNAGDEIVLTQMEHHSNLVPWIMLAKRKGLNLKYIPITRDWKIDLKDVESVITKKTRLLSITAMSNVLGTITPISQIVSLAHSFGAKVLVDGAQSVPHIPTDVVALGCDFLVFSGHKMLGPTGTGVLYARRELLEMMPPYKGGGEMISVVKFDDVTFNKVPYKFEAGTPNIAGVVGLGAAIDYLNRVGMENVRSFDEELTHYAISRLTDIKGLKIYGPLESQ